MEQPVLFVSTDHDFGAPGAPVRLRSSFLGFSDLPHDVGENKEGPAAELHGTEAVPLPGRRRGGAQGGRRRIPRADEAAPASRQGGCRAAPDQPRRRAHEERELGTCILATTTRTRPRASLAGGPLIPRADVLDEAKGWLAEDGAITLEADIRVYSKTPPLCRLRRAA